MIVMSAQVWLRLLPAGTPDFFLAEYIYCRLPSKICWYHVFMLVPKVAA